MEENNPIYDSKRKQTKKPNNNEKNLGINLTKAVKDLHTENYKITDERN